MSKDSCISKHLDVLRIGPFGLPSAPRTSRALSTAAPGPARPLSSKYQALSKSC